MTLTWADLRAADVGQPDCQEIVIALGRGRIVAPCRIAEVRAQPLAAAGYKVVHTDPEEPGETVTVFVEHPRIEPSY